MHAFVSYAFIGFCVGLIWGLGCALALLYSIYLVGYRRAVQDSIAAEKPERFKRAMKKLQVIDSR